MPLKNRLFVTGTGNHRQPLFTFTCNPWSTVLKLQVAGNIMCVYYYERQLYICRSNVMNQGCQKVLKTAKLSK